MRGSQRLIKTSNTYLLPLASLKTSGHASDVRPGEDCNAVQLGVEPHYWVLAGCELILAALDKDAG